MGTYIGKVPNPVLESNEHYMTSPFGERTYKGKKVQHNGIDLIKRGKVWTPASKLDHIISMADGVVVECSYSSTRGYYVGIKTNGYIHRYLHMKKGSILVKKGDKVVKGQRIGYMGSSGEVDGPHLHLAIVNPKGNFVNPLDYLEGTKSFDGSTPTEEIYYQSSLVTSTSYLPKVKIGTNDYAGVLKSPMDCIKIDKLTYRVQAIGRTNYYSWVTGCSDKIYAGVQGKKICKLQIKGNYKYRVYVLTNEKAGTGKWLSWVKGETDYAGLKNYPITAVQIKKA